MILYRKITVKGETIYRIAEPRDIIRAHTAVKNKRVSKKRKYIRPPRATPAARVVQDGKPRRVFKMEPESVKYEDIRGRFTGSRSSHKPGVK